MTESIPLFIQKWTNWYEQGWNCASGFSFQMRITVSILLRQKLWFNHSFGNWNIFLLYIIKHSFESYWYLLPCFYIEKYRRQILTWLFLIGLYYSLSLNLRWAGEWFQSLSLQLKVMPHGPSPALGPSRLTGWISVPRAQGKGKGGAGRAAITKSPKSSRSRLIRTLDLQHLH